MIPMSWKYQEEEEEKQSFYHPDSKTKHDINVDENFQKHIKLRQHDIDLFHILNSNKKNNYNAEMTKYVYKSMSIISTTSSPNNIEYAQTYFWWDEPAYNEINAKYTEISSSRILY